MDQKIHRYENDEISISYDLKRCIHAKECVKGLTSVFDPEKRPWIQPEGDDPARIAEVIERCPTGALHYEMKDGNRKETAPPVNSISITPDGPVYIRGNLVIKDAEDNILLKDTRFALCRCGRSSNKPACDNTHEDISFEASSSFDAGKLSAGSPTEERDNPELELKMMKNGPMLVTGPFQMYSETCQPKSCTKNIALCRCGASSNKPFCDGTHKDIDFQG